MERIDSSPLPAQVCPNCGGYMLPPKCVCGWESPVVVDDDDDDSGDTDIYCPQEMPEIGEAGA